MDATEKICPKFQITKNKRSKQIFQPANKIPQPNLTPINNLTNTSSSVMVEKYTSTYFYLIECRKNQKLNLEIFRNKFIREVLMRGRKRGCMFVYDFLLCGIFGLFFLGFDYEGVLIVG